MDSLIPASDTEVIWSAAEEYGKQVSAKRGRPTRYNKELAARILDEILDGKTLREVCRESWCPRQATILLWMWNIHEFSVALSRVRELQAHGFADQLLEVSGNALKSLQGDKSDTARVNAFRLQFEALRYRASVQNQVYNEKRGTQIANVGVSVTIAGLEPAKVIEG